MILAKISVLGVVQSNIIAYLKANEIASFFCCCKKLKPTASTKQLMLYSISATRRLRLDSSAAITELLLGLHQQGAVLETARRALSTKRIECRQAIAAKHRLEEENGALRERLALLQRQLVRAAEALAFVRPRH